MTLGSPIFSRREAAYAATHNKEADLQSSRTARVAAIREIPTSSNNPVTTRDEMLHDALDVLRAVRANYKAWRELWPHEQAAVCKAGETLEAELKRRGQ